MEPVGIKELKAHASAIVRRVEEEGAEIEIARRGKVVARLVPTIQVGEEEREKRWDGLFQLLEEIKQRVPPGAETVNVTDDLRRDL
jgi:prevent-host-death family protein